MIAIGTPGSPEGGWVISGCPWWSPLGLESSEGWSQVISGGPWWSPLGIHLGSPWWSQVNARVSLVNAEGHNSSSESSEGVSGHLRWFSGGARVSRVIPGGSRIKPRWCAKMSQVIPVLVSLRHPDEVHNSRSPPEACEDLNGLPVIFCSCERLKESLFFVCLFFSFNSAATFRSALSRSGCY